MAAAAAKAPACLAAAPRAEAGVLAACALEFPVERPEGVA